MNLEERLHGYRDQLDHAIDGAVETVSRPVLPPGAHVTRPWARVLVAALVASAIVAGVVGVVARLNSGGKEGIGIEAFDTTLTQSARFEMEMTDTVEPGGRVVYSSIESGEFDFGHQSGRVTASTPIENAIPTKSRPIETLYVDGRAYRQIDATTAATISSNARRGKQWITAPPTNDPAQLANPFTTIALVLKRATSLRDLGMTHVDGQLVHHERASLVTPLEGTLPPGVTPITAALDLYVDSRTRLVRIVWTTPEPGGGSFSTRYDFSDYGVGINVAAPPADEVLSAIDVSPPPPHLHGHWSLVASGSSHGVDWKLYRADADHQRVCWSFETNLSSSGSQGFSLPGGLHHDGHPATCTRTGIWASPVQYISAEQFVPSPSVPIAELLVAVVDRDVVRVETDSRAIPIDNRFGDFVDIPGHDTYVVHLANGTVLHCAASVAYNPLSGGATCDIGAHQP